MMSSGYPCVVLFSDTVGFIKKLPHQLVESFKSTLEEVTLADLLILVVDCSEEQYQERITHTREVLTEIGAQDVPYVLVYNKIDLIDEFQPVPDSSVKSFGISAAQNKGIAALQAEIIAASSGHLRQKSQI